MLDKSTRQTSSYNPELKIWSGASEPSSYSNDLTIAANHFLLKAANHFLSVGLIHRNIRMRIVSESGQALGPNERGEIHCHLGQHWGGYFGNALARSEVQDSDGWIRTGDLGYFDDDNYLYIVGRKSDFLRFAMEMYYPREIEEVIAQMPEVSEVCVFGIWNEIDGDAAAASVAAKAGCQLTANQVLDFVAENISEDYKQLHAGVQIVPNLAKNLNGKVNRQAVKEEFLKATGQI
ncbi:luciferin 4-monooxygenase-like [Drosophila albomicans]|uniref:Luciferin 4-monooxygenase-like n=1 Tax=Drosophila albomicans TaxID=7291 RepID=A0A6P8XN55_DROAB|nr:luciferin 4-monooxygenase-like [Drosophila albomicans]